MLKVNSFIKTVIKESVTQFKSNYIDVCTRRTKDFIESRQSGYKFTKSI